MNREDIIRMALEAEVLSKYESPTGFCAEAAVKFAALVASAEREACAKIADELVGHDLEHNFSALIAHNIRARKQA